MVPPLRERPGAEASGTRSVEGARLNLGGRSAAEPGPDARPSLAASPSAALLRPPAAAASA